MSKNFEELDYQKTALGELILRRRVMHSLGDLDVYEVKLGDAFLMSSLFHEVEVALSHLRAGGIGGNGLGCGGGRIGARLHGGGGAGTSGGALAPGGGCAPPVIGWHQRGLVPLGPELTGDARCRLVEGDFFARAASAEGFDAEQPGRRFDAICWISITRRAIC